MGKHFFLVGKQHRNPLIDVSLFVFLLAMQGVCVCIAALLAAAPAAGTQLGSSDGNLVLLQRQAEAKLAATADVEIKCDANCDNMLSMGEDYVCGLDMCRDC